MNLGIYCSDKITDVGWIEEQILNFVYEITESCDHSWRTIEKFSITCSNQTTYDEILNIIVGFWPTKKIGNMDEADVILVLTDKNEHYGSFMNDYNVDMNIRRYEDVDIYERMNFK